MRLICLLIDHGSQPMKELEFLTLLAYITFFGSNVAPKSIIARCRTRAACIKSPCNLKSRNKWLQFICHFQCKCLLTMSTTLSSLSICSLVSLQVTLLCKCFITMMSDIDMDDHHCVSFRASSRNLGM